jgi:hypothetical protein
MSREPLSGVDGTVIVVHGRDQKCGESIDGVGEIGTSTSEPAQPGDGGIGGRGVSAVGGVGGRDSNQLGGVSVAIKEGDGRLRRNFALPPS